MTLPPIPNSNILTRVFWLSFKGRPRGTAFAVDVEGRQYVVTAWHVARDCEHRPAILFRQNEQLVSFENKLRFIGENIDSDVAVFAADQILVPKDFDVSLGSADLYYGSIGYALGFPSALTSKEIGFLPEGKPLPVPALAVAYFNSEGETTCVAGYVTNGFSGGPIIFPKLGSRRTEWAIVGVCVAFPTLPRPIDMKGAPLEFEVREPTGLIRMAKVSVAIEIINGNPSGYPLGEQ